MSPGFDVRMTISGIQEAQRDNLRMIAALEPGGAVEAAVQVGLIKVHRYAVSVTHVDSGSLRAAHRMEMESGGLRGTVFIDPGVVNPRSKQLPAEYGVYEHARGGTHAFYDRAYNALGGNVLDQAVESIWRAIDGR